MGKTFNGPDVELLGKRIIEDGDLDPILAAEAKKMSKWAHWDAMEGAAAVLGISIDEISVEQITQIKHAIFNSKYEYLINREANTDPY